MSLPQAHLEYDRHPNFVSIWIAEDTMATTRLAYSVAVSLLTLGFLPASHAQTQPCPPLQLDAGMACVGFALGIDFLPPEHRVEKTFLDKNGNLLRSFRAGQGTTFFFSRFEVIDAANNLCHLTSSISVKTNGSVESITCCTNKGEQIWTTTGHNLLILFPTDAPAGVGPSTNLYSGRLVFFQTGDNHTTLQSFNGSATDICAALK
jgi:hypothetical protein